MTLLVINISLSTPDINKLRRLRVTTCRTVVRTRGVDNNWPVAALTARSEARYMLRIAISAYTSPAFDAPIDGVSVGILLCRLVLENKNGLAIRLWKIFEDMFIRFDTIHERDRQTGIHGMTAKAALAWHRAATSELCCTHLSWKCVSWWTVQSQLLASWLDEGSSHCNQCNSSRKPRADCCCSQPNGDVLSLEQVKQCDQCRVDKRLTRRFISVVARELIVKQPPKW